MISAFSDFLKDTLVENLRKPLQPAGLFAAAVWLLLNYSLVVPALARAGVGWASALLGLSGALQAVLFALLVLVLAYLLLSLSSAIRKLATGEAWDKSWLGRKLVERQKEILKELEYLWAGKSTAPDKSSVLGAKRARWQRMTRFPEEEYLAPTALGNAFNATSQLIYHRYGIDLTALWTHMETAIAEKTAVVTRIDNEKATIDFLLNSAFILVVFFVEHVLVNAWLELWGAVVVSLVFPLLGYLLYRAAVVKALSWGQAVLMAFDLHRGELRTSLGLRDFTSREDERSTWRKASNWWSLEKKKFDDIFAAEPKPTAPSPAVTATENTNVKLTDAIVVNCTKPPAQMIEWEKRISYVILVSTTTSGDEAVNMCCCPVKGIYVRVSDSRVPEIAGTVLPTPETDLEKTSKVTAVGKPLLTGKAVPQHDQLWYIEELPYHGATSLRYSLPIGTVLKAEIQPAPLVISAIDVEERRQELGYKFVIEREVGAGEDNLVDVVLEAFDSRIKLSRDSLGTLTIIGAGGKMKVSLLRPELNPKLFGVGAGYRWKLGVLANGEKAILTYSAKKK